MGRHLSYPEVTGIRTSRHRVFTWVPYALSLASNLVNITTHLQQDTKPCATINFETRKATFASNGDCNRTLTKKKEMDDRLPRNLWNLQYISCKLGVMSHTGAEHFGHDKACNPATQEQTFAICSYSTICRTSTITLNTPHDTLMTQKLIVQTIHRLHVYGRAKETQP